MVTYIKRATRTLLIEQIINRNNRNIPIYIWIKMVYIKIPTNSQENKKIKQHEDLSKWTPYYFIDILPQLKYIASKTAQFSTNEYNGNNDLHINYALEHMLSTLNINYSTNIMHYAEYMKLILIYRSDIEPICYLLDLVIITSWLSGILNLPPDTTNDNMEYPEDLNNVTRILASSWWI